MQDYEVVQIRASDRRGIAELEALLAQEGISRDANLDYTVGIYGADGLLAATGSCYADTLRCLAVDAAHRGEGLLNLVVSHLMAYQAERGNAHVFVYTKTDKARFFGDLGFYEIVHDGDRVVFMENRRDGFSSFLRGLAATACDCAGAALVMNCNPFTLGHRYLVEYTAARSPRVYLFVVEEDASFFPFADRLELIRAGCADIPNVAFLRSGSYMISNAVFPSYFLRDKEAVIEAQASLDIEIFKKIAGVLGVTCRYVGEEPFSVVTEAYNRIMRQKLPEAGIACVVVPRKETDGAPISASKVRQLLHDGQIADTRALVPQSTYDYFFTDRGRAVIENIRKSTSVVHY